MPMTSSIDSDPAVRSHRPDPRQTVQTLLDATDESLKRGARPGAAGVAHGLRPARLHPRRRAALGRAGAARRATRAPARRRWPCRWCATPSLPDGTASSSPSSTTRRASCSACSRSKRPPRRSRPASIPPPPPTCTRCARCSRPRTPTAVASPTPSPGSRTATTHLQAVQQYAGRLAAARVGQGDHPRRDRPRRHRGHRGGRRAADRARRLPAEDAAARSPRRRGLAGHDRHRDVQGHVARARVPHRVHLGCRP